MLFIKTSFREKIAHLKSAKEMAYFLIVENASLDTTYPDVCMASFYNAESSMILVLRKVAKFNIK